VGWDFHRECEYHTALRLLRCGSKVIVTSRYPRDAEARYLAESDSAKWSEQLKIVGADFRSASDVFHLVAVVQACLRQWDENGEGKLDILVNNAAQTLTDSLKKEDKAVKLEKRLEASENSARLLLGEAGYEARVRGGVQDSRLLANGSMQSTMFLETRDTIHSPQDFTTTTSSSPSNDNELATQETTLKSSWVQSLSQIPYEDVISAHSVNTFVPLILIRELLPLMGSPRSAVTPPNITSSQEPTKPLAHIINVSSREGIFESNPSSTAKNGHHVHTNLTKAALNMLTETEAAPAWRKRRVAINSVDPGFMSAAPEVERWWRERKEGDGGGSSWGCPIGWEDGAGRVLWPVAVGEMGKGFWGRFLKHFGEVEIGR